jgi:hypothetical protein
LGFFIYKNLISKSYKYFYDEVTGSYYFTTICYGSSMDMQILTDLFGYYGEAAKVLGMDQEFAGKVAAARALLQLTAEVRWGEVLLELLEHPQLQVRRAALMDLGAVGWRPALEPIRATLAENSLKLIALRGLVEQGSGEPGLEALLGAMDDLL